MRKRHCKPAVEMRMPAVGLRKPAVGMLLFLCGCAQPNPSGRISLSDLENAPHAESALVTRIVLSEPAALSGLYKPLCSRLGLLVIRTPADWQRVCRAAPEWPRTLDPADGEEPDFRHGAIVGIVSLAGTPLHGGWPIILLDTRIEGGDALLTAEFRGGTYFPDGTSYLEATYVPHLTRVAVVDVNGVRYYLE